MVIVFVVIFVVVVAVIVRALAKSAPNLSVDDDELQVRAPSVQRGAPAQPTRDGLVVAHGLIIRSSLQSKSVRKGDRRCERHAMTIEVEIPGRSGEQQIFRNHHRGIAWHQRPIAVLL